MEEFATHDIARHFALTGLAGIAFCVLIWRWSDGGGDGLGAMILPDLLYVSIMTTVVAGGIWWYTR